MNIPVQATTDETHALPVVFVSYATADRKEALAVCKAIEQRGAKCWISCRDVPPGDNYQESIVRAIRTAQAMVLVFSEAANNSDEIKKELSLASKHHVSIMALRIEDVEPSDAFAYELSTRQWIDAFESWDKSIDALVRHVQQVSSTEVHPTGQQAAAAYRRSPSRAGRGRAVAATAGLLLVIAAGAWWYARPGPAAPHSMMVRLTGFSNLGSDLPADVPGALRDEITAAFNDDGAVGVSTAEAPPAGSAPAYALGGTLRRAGDQIKVNVRLTNERSGVTLWSNMFSYDADQLPRIPRRVAVDAGSMMRCGLFGAATYGKPLSDAVLSDYLQYCQNIGTVQWEPGKALASATKVVAAAPDFSWGWSAVADGAANLAYDDPDGPRSAQYRKQSLDAANKAIELDKSNSEALDRKATLLAPRDFMGRELLLKQALDARPLPCGCEHHFYGLFLQSVGRNREAIEEFQRSTEVLALDVDSQYSLAEALLIAGREDESKTHFDAGDDLSRDEAASDQTSIYIAPVTADFAKALKAIQNPKVEMNQPLKTALQAGFEAMVSSDSAAKTRAIALLMAVPPAQQRRNVASLLAALGANREAMQVVAAQSARHRVMSSGWLFLPAARGVLADPSFATFAQKLGLMGYWKTTQTRPDVCSDKAPPSFCAAI